MVLDKAPPSRTIIPIRTVANDDGRLRDVSTLPTRIRQGSPSAERELHDLVWKSAAHYILIGCRNVNPAAFDLRLNDVFLVALEAVRARIIREPEELAVFIQTVLRCHINDWIKTFG